jgi:ribonuclease HII
VARSKSPAEPKAPSARARARAERHTFLLTHERALWSAGCSRVAGIDEVGAGPLAGPVVAACVVLDPARTDALVGVDDSKKLSAAARHALDRVIRESALAYALAECSVEEIDRINIREASMLAMQRALDAVEAQLGPVGHVLIDAHTLSVSRPQTPLIKGDATSLSIAAASIIAKVARDATMDAYATTYPGYGFDRHKGYGTAEHMAALSSLGATAIHRRSFAPVRAALASAPGDLAAQPG